jgi:hypothetical protein
MKLISWRIFLGVLAGIGASILFYLFVSSTTYIFLLGSLVGVYLSRVAAIKDAAIVGAIIAVPLGILMVFVTPALRLGSMTEFLGALTGVIFLAIIAAIYAAIYVVIKRWLQKGNIFFG